MVLDQLVLLVLDQLVLDQWVVLDVVGCFRLARLWNMFEVASRRACEQIGRPNFTTFSKNQRNSDLFVSSPECFGRSVPAHWYQKSRIPTVPKMFGFVIYF